ncbi:MAG: DNA polymerase III subunit alpha [Acetobacteraceae bacterium]
MTPRYAELQVTTNYSFLRGASHPEELFAEAARLEIPALGITDRGTLSGMVRAHQAAAGTGVRLVVGCRLDLAAANGEKSVLVYPADRPAYARLCRLLTLGKSRAGKGGCRLSWDDLAEAGEGQLVVLIPNWPDAALDPALARLAADFPGRAWLALTVRRRPNDAERLEALAEAARRARIPTLATNDVLHHVPERRILADVLTSIREKCTIDAAGFRRERSADRHLKPPAEMTRLFTRHPAAIANTAELAERSRFSLAELRYQYPKETFPGVSPQQTLEHLTWEAAPLRYPEGVPESVVSQLRHELSLIAELAYAPYFLTVHNIVRHARMRGILCQGRGSAANSAVCYVLGITSIDPTRSGLLFERFISAARKEPPDIDVDFEHERREEVIQWVYDTYGRERAALTAIVIRYRPKSALRDVGKAMGLGEDKIAALSAEIWGTGEDDFVTPSPLERDALVHARPPRSTSLFHRAIQTCGDSTSGHRTLGADRRLRLTLDLARALIGFPRHLSQHPGGFVLTEDRLDELVPIEPAAMPDRQVIEWDKDDIDALNFMKVDVLGLGMLSCIRRSFDLLAEHRGLRLDLSEIPPADPETYEMIRAADTLGVFQIESRAQRAMLPRLAPRTFYDLVIEVAIVRPGPIQGDMVHPYLRRRQGLEPVSFPTPELEAVLGRTHGVPLFQEQAMRIAIVAAGFTAEEADGLRRSMATFRFSGQVSHFREKLIQGMVRNGYPGEFAERTFRQIEGFGSYGFPESHAASFALIAYASSWLKCHHPEIFCAALLNSQPMGFYAPAQIVRDAREHGIEIRPVAVNSSRFDCTLEATSDRFLAVRLGLRMVKGLSEAVATRLVTARRTRPFVSLADCAERTGIPPALLERVAVADGFSALGLDRRHALWAVRGLPATPLPLFAAAGGERTAEPDAILAPLAEASEVTEDYRSTGLSLRRHPLSFLRRELSRRAVAPCASLATALPGRTITVAGLVLVRQRPGSARGVTFMTIEDETGEANLIIWPDLFTRARHLVLTASLIACTGKIEREGPVIHLIAGKLADLSFLLQSLEAEAAPLQVSARSFR